MKLVDVHCHLEGERFEKDINEVIKRAEDAGVVLIVNSGVNPETNRLALELSKENKIVKPSFGIYPIDALIHKFKDLNDDYPRKIEAFDYKEELKWIEENKESCVAIGEVGLDFKVIEKAKNVEEVKKEQIKIFEDIIGFAKKINKPLVVHSRGAEVEVVETLEKHGVKNVIIHSFNGNKKLIKRIVENGWYFSVPAVITRLQHFQMLVEMVDLKQLLTETDAPYLAPVAGERSEPANVAITVREIARIKNLTENEIAEQIYENTKKILNL
jgi:TatD DNase family protein